MLLFSKAAVFKDVRGSVAKENIAAVYRQSLIRFCQDHLI